MFLQFVTMLWANYKVWPLAMVRTMLVLLLMLVLVLVLVLLPVLLWLLVLTLSPQLLNFLYVPNEWRVLFVNLTGLCWGVYTSRLLKSK